MHQPIALVNNDQPRPRLARTAAIEAGMEKALRLCEATKTLWWRALDSLVAKGELPPDAVYQALFWIYWDHAQRLGYIPPFFILRGEQWTEADSERYRPDWIVCDRADEDRGGRAYDLRLAIEIDGQIHYLSEEQVRRDHRRDHHLRADGWEIERFTNGEVVDDGFACVDRAARTANRRRLECMRRELDERRRLHWWS